MGNGVQNSGQFTAGSIATPWHFVTAPFIAAYTLIARNAGINPQNIFSPREGASEQSGAQCARASFAGAGGARAHTPTASPAAITDRSQSLAARHTAAMDFSSFGFHSDFGIRNSDFPKRFLRQGDRDTLHPSPFISPFPHSDFGIRTFGFVSDFEFRNSDFSGATMRPLPLLTRDLPPRLPIPRLIAILFLLATFAMLLLGAVAISGCAANTPAVQADTAKLSADQTSLAGLQSQLKTLQAQIAASTQPATTSALTDQLSTVQTQIASLQKQISADAAKRTADSNAAVAAQVSAGAQVASSTIGAVPSPWALVLSMLVMAGGQGLSAWIGKSSGTSTAAAAQQSTQAAINGLATATQAHAATLAAHATVLQTAITALANSTPALATALPASLQPLAVTLSSAIAGAAAAGTPSSGQGQTLPTAVASAPAAATPAV